MLRMMSAMALELVRISRMDESWLMRIPVA